MKKIFFVFFLAVAFRATILSAQDAPSKFGKISDSELLATHCFIDSSAHAYYVFDCGITFFSYPQATVRADDPSSNSGFVMNTQRHFRIKFVDATALDYGNIEIPLYVLGSTEEKLTDLDAVSFNMDNGKVVKSKFEKKKLIYEEKSKNWKIVKIPMPNVKAGTVIDVRYTVQSRFYFNLRNWHFQYSIPVLYSKCVTNVPEYFNYHRNVKGFIPIKSENDQRKGSIKFTEIDNGWGTGLSGSNNGSLNGRTTTRYNVEYVENSNTYIGENIPAFVEDSYLKSSNNYCSQVEFELAYTKFPRTPIKQYTLSWEGIVADLLDDEDFGSKFKHNNFYEEYADSLKKEEVLGEGLINIAVDYIRSHIKWNEYNAVYLSKSLKRTFEEGVGNSSEINVSLVSLLNKLGVEAYPVILSTQKNGTLGLTHPTISDFNYTIALARVNGKNILIDATEPLLQINQLPVRCLNDKGLVVKEGTVEWVDLVKGSLFKSQTSFFMQIDSTYTLNGQYVCKLDNHAAYLKRLDIKRHNGVDGYVPELQKSAPGIVINTNCISGYDSLYKPLVIDCNISLSNAIETAGSLIFVTPFLFETMKQSPFKLEKRTYPIEYDYPAQQTLTAQYDIPENMSVESIPQPSIFTVPDKSAKYIYSASQIGNKVIITSIYNRSKLLYLPDEYDTLKEFYRMIIAKQTEKIVLKVK